MSGDFNLEFYELGTPFVYFSALCVVILSFYSAKEFVKNEKPDQKYLWRHSRGISNWPFSVLFINGLLCIVQNYSYKSFPMEDFG